MKTRLLAFLFAVTFGCLAPPAQAWVSFHGREAIRSDGWSEALAAIINHPSRVCGQIGPMGPKARFHFSGDATTFNEILAKYGAIPGQAHVLYLEAEAAPTVEGFKENELHDFDVSINQTGQSFVHLYTAGRIRLEDLKIPAGVSVEVLLPTDPDQRAKLQAEQQRVAAFVAARKAK